MYQKELQKFDKLVNLDIRAAKIKENAQQNANVSNEV